MKQLRIGLGVALALAGLPASAAVVRTNLGLAHDGATCDGPATYGYVARWRAGPGATFQVNSGNHCRIAANVCSIAGKDCRATCGPDGLCSSPVHGCQVGRGAPWIKVTAVDGTVFQQMTAAAPGKCQ